MNFTLPCDTYVRLSRVAQNYIERDPPTPDYMKAMYLEIKSGEAFAVCTNIKLAAIEYLGKTNEPDGKMHLTLDPILLKQAQSEIPFNSSLQIVYNEMLAFANVKTTFGYNYPGNALIPAPATNEFDHWRSWAPDKPATKAKGVLSMIPADVMNLGLSSPSGRIVFQEFIDNTKPCVIRDRFDPKWMGLFMPCVVDENNKIIDIEPAKLPDWFKL
jgi:hypothetical protein